MIDPRAAALQGLGYGPGAIALQGLVAIQVEQEQPRAPVIGGGGRAMDDELLRRQVLEKWEVIERARGVDRTADQGVDRTPKQPAPVVLEDLPTPSITMPLAAAAPLPGVDMAAPMLLPDAAEAARLARIRDDEEALLMLLLEA